MSSKLCGFRRFVWGAALAGASMTTGSQAWAQASLPLEGPQILTAAPGQGVGIAGDWAITGDPIDDCLANIYRFDYSTYLWGDGNGNPGVPYQTIDGQGGCNAQPSKGFGSTVSINEELLIIGAPFAKISGGGTKEIGLIYVYQLQDTGDPAFPNGEWVELIQEEEPTGQDGAHFGTSVSVRRNALNPDKFLFAIGAPDYDVLGPPRPGCLGGDDSGRVFFLEFDLTLGTNGDFVPGFDAIDGCNAGDRFGFSVTSDGVYGAVGAPLADNGGFTDLGAVYVIEEITIGGTAPQIIATIDWDDVPVTDRNNDLRIGSEVSLNAGYLMTGGEESFTFQRSNLINFNWIHTQTLGAYGDVTQSDDVQAYGRQGGSVVLYTAPVSDTQIPTEVFASDIPGSPDVTTYAEDINLNRGRLMVNGETASQAYAYTLPCGSGLDTMESLVWKMVSLPCAPNGATVAEVFADLGATVANPGDAPTSSTTFIVTQQGGVEWNGSIAANNRLGASDVVDQDRSYWLITRNSQLNWGLGNVTGPTRTPISTANASGDVIGHYDVSLPDGDAQVSDNGPDEAREGAIVSVMLGNPFPTEIDVSSILVECSLIPGSSTTPVSITTAGSCYRGGPAVYVYDLGAADTSNGADVIYRAVVADTPGMNDIIEPYQGFWVLVEPAALDNVWHLPLEK